MEADENFARIKKGFDYLQILSKLRGRSYQIGSLKVSMVTPGSNLDMKSSQEQVLSRDPNYCQKTKSADHQLLQIDELLTEELGSEDFLDVSSVSNSDLDEIEPLCLEKENEFSVPLNKDIGQ